MIWTANFFIEAWIILLSVSSVWAQLTITTPDAFGDTVVIVESTDLGGDSVKTTVLTTLTGVFPTTTTPTTTTTTTTNPEAGGGGPVGYTTSTNEAVGPTTYVYTTTDDFGSKTLVTTIFNPTYQPTSPWPSVSAGTIINYSDYTASYPQTSRGSSRKTSGFRISTMALIAGVSTVLGVAAGALCIVV